VLAARHLSSVFHFDLVIVEKGNRPRDPSKNESAIASAVGKTLYKGVIREQKFSMVAAELLNSSGTLPVQ
jgi:hypothetical protein